MIDLFSRPPTVTSAPTLVHYIAEPGEDSEPVTSEPRRRQMRDYYVAHLDAIKAWQADYRERNRVATRERQRNWVREKRRQRKDQASTNSSQPAQGGTCVKGIHRTTAWLPRADGSDRSDNATASRLASGRVRESATHGVPGQSFAGAA